MAILYVVATPIGNLEDITLRALRILKEVDVIACEDTRHTLGLLTHFGIQKKLISCHAQDEARGSKKILDLLDEEQTVAYCSDAGTPGLSDPGILAVHLARQAGHSVIPIPGASAFAALVSAGGIFFKAITFEGFLSVKPGKRRARLQELMSRQEAFLVYESPFRIVKLLRDIADIDSERMISVGRELTKLHEEIMTGTAQSAIETFERREIVKGEFAVLVSSAKK